MTIRRLSGAILVLPVPMEQPQTIWAMERTLSPAAPSANKQKTSSGQPRLPLYNAILTSRADTELMGSRHDSNVDNRILQRIKKCLDRAQHPTTPEGEANAAWHVASRLMSQHNVSQARVLADVDALSRQQHAGQSTVALRRSDDNTALPVRKQAFAKTIAAAISLFFDCKSYSSAGRRTLQFTFYGIADNTVAAALSFESTYNMIVEWARPRKGIGPKNSYCLGASGELMRRVRHEKADEEKLAQQQEETAGGIQGAAGQQRDSLQIDDRPSPPSPAASPPGGDDPDTACSDSDSDGNDHGWGVEPDFKMEDLGDIEDVDQAIRDLTKRESLSPDFNFDSNAGLSANEEALNASGSSRSLPRRGEDPDGGVTWSSRTQLIVFRQTASSVADEYFRAKDLKVSHKKARKRTICDRRAYKDGVRDGKLIDVRRKRIEAAESYSEN